MFANSLEAYVPLDVRLFRVSMAILTACRTGPGVKNPDINLSSNTELSPMQFAMAMGSPLCNESSTTD
jgi:hypothetical protein